MKSHGHARKGKETLTYRTWGSMIGRCYNPNNNRFYTHGARGIKVCPEWACDFEVFLDDMGECPGNGYSIERIDNDGDYCKENCKWATPTEQARNRRNSIIIEYKGESHSLAEWAEILEVNFHSLYKRIYVMKWSIEEALTRPFQKHNVDNKSRVNANILEFNGKEMVLHEWAQEFGVVPSAIGNQLKAGKPFEEIAQRYIEKNKRGDLRI